jgi:hypothetical protein
MKQGPSWEYKRSSASEAIPRILWNTKINSCSKIKPTMHNVLYCIYLASILTFPATCFGIYITIFKGVHVNYIKPF